MLNAEEKAQIRERLFNAVYERNQGPYFAHYIRDVTALLAALDLAEKQREQALSMIRKMRRLAYGELVEIDEYLGYVSDKVLSRQGEARTP